MRGSKRGFTLVELLAAIAIIAALLVVAGIYIGGYIGEARQRADARTLEVLNDAITRYKTQGGGTSGFTLGAPIGNILSRLQTPINWNGLSHQVMKTGVTYPAASLKAVGSGSAYRFYQYNSVTQNAPAAGTPTSDNPNGAVGYIEVSSSDGINMTCVTTSGYWALKIGSGTPTIFASNVWAIYIGGGSPGTFWACAAEDDSTPSGVITEVNCDGGYQARYNTSALDVSALTSLNVLICNDNQLTSLNLSANTALQSLVCSSNQLTSLNLSANTALYHLLCHSNQLTSLNLSSNTGLINLWCHSNQLTSLNLSGLTALGTLNCSSNQLSSLNLSSNTALSSLNCNSNQLTSLTIAPSTNLYEFFCSGNQLTSIDIPGAHSLFDFDCSYNQIATISWPSTLDFNWFSGARLMGNPSLVGTTGALNALFASLPTFSGGQSDCRLIIGSGAPSATDSIATGKGWTVDRSD